MRIFVFEFITGGGWHVIDPEQGPSGSLLTEGRVMRDAVVSDLLAIADVEVRALVDHRLARDGPSRCTVTTVQDASQLWDEIAAGASKADVSLLIAPEFDGHLFRASQVVESVGGSLVSPSSDFIRLASNKQATAEYLAARDVPTPQGGLFHSNATHPAEILFPAVMKPNDGAGSTDVTLLRGADALAQMPASDSVLRWESYHPGHPVSVASICGTEGCKLLPPCHQRLSADGRFTYLGGSCPIDDALAKRASRLGERVINALPRTTGYVGIDLILGDDPSGSDDVVIEVNPRLTTSYVGLRKLMRENLAQTMLDAAQGKSVTLSTRPGRVEFSASGDVQYHRE